jgi:aryl-alcohol dehydrogenase-like predicted oxidoreductase
MRYRPFGRAGVSVSIVTLAIDDQAAKGGPQGLRALLNAGLEAGVNSYHIETCHPEVLRIVGECLGAVERRLLFISLRLGLRPGRTGLTRDFTPESLTGVIDATLHRMKLQHLDLGLLDEPGEDEFPVAALTALKLQRTTGRLTLLGVGGANDAMDAYIDTNAFDAIATPFHLRVGWQERHRLKIAGRRDLGCIGYDYFPEMFRSVATTPTLPKKRGLFGALTGEPAPHPLAGVGTYAFLHDTPGWTAEQLCLAYAQLEPSLATIIIRAGDVERLTALASVPDRDLPPGMAAQVEMAGFAKEA